MLIKLLSGRIHYGWVVAVSCFLITFSLGETFWSFGVFFKPLEEEFGWSRALISTGYTIFLITYGISSATMGRLADKYGPKPILLAAAVFAGTGISLCSITTNINQFRLFFALCGLGAGATWSVPTATVQRWFNKRQGFVLAAVTTGVGAGALIFAPLINHFILSYGWRQAYLITGIIFFVLIAFTSVLIEHSPERVGLEPYGGPRKLQEFKTEGWKTGEAVRTFPFWNICIMLSLSSICFNVLSVHLIPYATDMGISKTAAAAAMGLVGGFTIPGRLITGFLAERLGWQRGLWIAYFAAAVSVVWLLLLKNQGMLYIFVVIYGFSHGGRVPAQVGVVGSYFGTRSLAELIGITAGVSMIIGSAGPYIAGFLYDITGGYSIAFIIVIAAFVLDGILAIVVKPPSYATAINRSAK